MNIHQRGGITKKHIKDWEKIEKNCQLGLLPLG